MSRWCKQCGEYGHRKWLFLGTHKTHRLYIRYKVWGVNRKFNKIDKRRI